MPRGVHGTLVVIAAGRTHKNQLKGAISALDRLGAPVSCLVFTMLLMEGPDAYGYGRYGTEAGYGYNVDLKLAKAKAVKA